MQRNRVHGEPIILPGRDVFTDEDVLIGTHRGNPMADNAVVDLPAFDGKDLWLALPAKLSLDAGARAMVLGRRAKHPARAGCLYRVLLTVRT
jgi:hypothetical protein